MILFNKKRALILRGKPSVKINALFKLFPSRIQLTVVFSEEILSGCGEFCGSLVTDEGKRCEEIAKVFVYDLYLDLQLFSLCEAEGNGVRVHMSVGGHLSAYLVGVAELVRNLA